MSATSHDGADVTLIETDGECALEAQAFAYLAVRNLRGLALSYPGTTGVPRPMPGGVLANVERPITG